MTFACLTAGQDGVKNRPEGSSFLVFGLFKVSSPEVRREEEQESSR
jgi:hypothetical protein